MLSTLFTGDTASDRYVEMTVKGIGPGGTDATILPRLRLISSPYAFLAANAINATRLVNATNSQIVTVTGTSVGINNAIPGATLDVQGSAKVSGPLTVASNITASTITASNITASAITASNIISTTGYGFIPLGGIIMWSGANVPDGWALCDGRTVNGYKTPDLRDRFIVGSGGKYKIGDTGGQESVTLTADRMPKHTHSFKDYYFAEGDDRGVSYFTHWGDKKVGSNATDKDNDHLFFVDNSTDSAGQGQAHENRPPYYALAFIMRVR